MANPSTGDAFAASHVSAENTHAPTDHGRASACTAALRASGPASPIVLGRIEPGQGLQRGDQRTNVGSRTAYLGGRAYSRGQGCGEPAETRHASCPKSAWHLRHPERCSAWFFESQPSQDFVVGLFELRSIIEPAAAALAAQRRAPDDLAQT